MHSENGELRSGAYVVSFIIVVMVYHTAVRQQGVRTLQIDLNAFVLVQLVAYDPEKPGIDEKREGP